MTHGRFVTAAVIVAVAILLAFVALRVRLPIEFERPGRILAQAEWLLLKTGSDTFEARQCDRRHGERRQFDLYRFERGDLVRFSLAESIIPGALVAAGDVVAHLYSHATQTLLDQLSLELREAEAGLQAAATGEKAAVVAQARSDLAGAEALLGQKRSEFRRSEGLHTLGVVSQATFESAESELRQAEATVAAAQGRLRAAEAGEKAEIVEVYHARVELLRRQLQDACARAAADTIRVPIAGEIVTLQGDSALVRVADVDTVYVVAPVSPSRAEWLRPGQSVVFDPLPRTQKPVSGEVVAIDRQAAVVAGRTFFWVTAAVPNPGGQLRPGVTGDLRFRGERVALLHWVLDRISHASDRALGA